MIRFPFFSRQSKVTSTVPDADLSKVQAVDQHSVEIAQFKEVLKSFGATRIDERLKILSAFLSTEQHVTLGELDTFLQQKDLAGVERNFLQETMEMFCRFGFAQEITFASHETRYEHHHLGTHHDHFICTRCGRIEEFVNDDLEKLQMAIARDKQFHPLQHRMEIYGLCAPCMGQREDTIPLHMAMRGERVRIIQITGGRTMQSRLAAMGLTQNSCIEVVAKGDAGPFIVAVEGVRMALGNTLTQHILVAHSCAHEDKAG